MKFGVTDFKAQIRKRFAFRGADPFPCAVSFQDVEIGAGIFVGFGLSDLAGDHGGAGNANDVCRHRLACRNGPIEHRVRNVFSGRVD